MISDEYLNELIQRKADGESFSIIRQELESKGIQEHKIKGIIQYVDNQVLNKAIKKSNRKRAFELKAVGFLLTALGLILSIGTYTGLIDLGDVVIIAYIPLAGGTGILGYTYSRRR